jgi:hypothetical protein
VLLTRAPLYSPPCGDFRARLACVRHAASVDSEPGSNSQAKMTARAPRDANELVEWSPGLKPESTWLSSVFHPACQTSTPAPGRSRSPAAPGGQPGALGAGPRKPIECSKLSVRGASPSPKGARGSTRALPTRKPDSRYGLLRCRKRAELWLGRPPARSMPTGTRPTGRASIRNYYPTTTGEDSPAQRLAYQPRSAEYLLNLSRFAARVKGVLAPGPAPGRTVWRERVRVRRRPGLRAPRRLRHARRQA